MKSVHAHNIVDSKIKSDSRARQQTFNKKQLNKKLKTLQIRTVANAYLIHISLDGSINESIKNDYLNRVASNDFECFLAINKISTAREKQSDYFNNYKKKILNERNGKKSPSKRSPIEQELKLFLKNEFSTDNTGKFHPDTYINSILNSKKLKLEKNAKQISGDVANNIPSINIVPTSTFSARHGELSGLTDQPKQTTDIEHDYLKTQAEKMQPTWSTNNQTASILTLSSNSSASGHLFNGPTKLSHSLNSALVTLTNKLAHKASKMHADALCDVSEKPPPIAKHSTRNYRRTISESSNESTLFHSAKNQAFHNAAGAGANAKAPIPCGHKASLFYNLKKLNNEKLIFTSNNAPIGLFSRLPFKLNSKSDLNESLIKSRHISINKSGSSHNAFILDVFELLDLDFDDYTNTGVMSYSNLIDPIVESKLSKFVRSNTKETNHDYLNNGNISDDYDDASENDELVEVGKMVYKRETSPFLITAYHPDYLDDPQLTELTAGKNRTCLKFASYSISLIDYVKPLDLKKEINQTFKEKFPHVQITLTKLRSIKRELLELGHESSLDFVIVAQAYVYFEKLILQGLVNKANRKYLAADCLILAAKLNDTTKKELNKLIDNIMDKFRFDSRKDLIAYEFGILVALEFNLIVKYEAEFVKHYERLLGQIDQKKLEQQHKFQRRVNYLHNQKLLYD